MSSYSEEISNLIQLIANDDIAIVLEKMQSLFKGNPKFYETLLLSAQYSDLAKSIRFGSIDIKEAEYQKNRIRFALIGIIQELEKGINSDMKIKSDFGKFFSDKKNININSLNIIGDANVIYQGNNVRKSSENFDGE